MTASLRGTPAPGASRALRYLLLLLWLEAGYAGALALVADAPLRDAAWQAAVCVGANLPLLIAVIKASTLPKPLARLSRSARAAVSALTGVVQLVLPWLGWSALVWLMSAGGLGLMDALRAGGAIAIFSYATGAALVVALRPRASDVQLTCLEVPIVSLPPAFDGYRILHLSDVHGGWFLSDAELEARLAGAASVNADIVAFTGDLTTGRDRPEAVAERLAGLSSGDGIVAVLGNHDHWIGEERAAKALVSRGVQLLGNSHVALSRNDSAIYVAGVKDCSYARADDLAAALKGIPEGATVVLLSHSPDIVRKPPAEKASLVLAGHTHGGQVVFPWIGPLYVGTRLGKRRIAGLHKMNGQWLFVNRGLGEVFPPLRLNCPPEIAVVTLRRATGSD